MIEALILLAFALAVVPFVVWGVVSSGIHWTRMRHREALDQLLRGSVRAFGAVGTLLAPFALLGEAVRRTSMHYNELDAAFARVNAGMRAPITAADPERLGGRLIVDPVIEGRLSSSILREMVMLGTQLIGTGRMETFFGIRFERSWHVDRDTPVYVTSTLISHPCLLIHPLALAAIEATDTSDRLDRAMSVLLERTHDSLDALADSLGEDR